MYSSSGKINDLRNGFLHPRGVKTRSTKTVGHQPASPIKTTLIPNRKNIFLNDRRASELFKKNF